MPDVLDTLVSLTQARRVGTSFRARCPAHEDSTPSLTMTRGTDRPVVIYCHAGCSTRDVLRALDLPEDFLSTSDASETRSKPEGLTRTNGAPAGGVSSRVVASRRYEVRSSDGALRAIHLRRDYGDGSKQMPWMHPDGRMSTSDDPVKPAELPLYGSERLSGAKPALVFVVEGEKAADALALVLEGTSAVAVGTVTGASSTPGPDALGALRGLDVALWPDRDDVGRDHMIRIASALVGIARQVATLDVPGLPEHGDAADWQGSYNDLLGLVVDARAPVVTPAPEPEKPSPQAADEWPVLASAAYHGVAGAAVMAMEPHTEADPVGILTALITMCGVVLGRTRVLDVAGAGVQAPSVFSLLVGESATGRKGTAVQAARAVVKAAYPELDRLVVTGLGSGEGLIAHLRREFEEAAKTGRPAEYRVLLDESEMARLLIAMGREGSILSTILRAAFDGTPLGRTVVTGSGMVTWHHVGLLGQVTPDELRERLAVTDYRNGFANRFLWIAVRQQRLVPFAAHPSRHVPVDVTTQLASILATSPRLTQVGMDDAAAALWEDLYSTLGSEASRRYGTLAALASREVSITLRLATIYALLDESDVVREEHLLAARALVDYSHASVRWIWRASTGHPQADALLAALRVEQEIAWLDMRDYGLRGEDAERAVDILTAAGLARIVVVPTSRRPKRIVKLV